MKKGIIITLLCSSVLCATIFYFITRDPRTLADITYLQEATSTICTNTTTNITYSLIDKRDQKIYTVAKLNDGRCWFTQDLNLTLSPEIILTNQDTDLNTTIAWTPSATSETHYDFATATASNTDSFTKQYTNAPNSICPKGWRLPKVYDGWKYNCPNEFEQMLLKQGMINTNLTWINDGFNKVQQPPLNFTVDTESAHYWTSTIYNTTHAYHLDFNANYISPGSNNRSLKFLVRCLIR